MRRLLLVLPLMAVGHLDVFQRRAGKQLADIEPEAGLQPIGIDLGVVHALPNGIGTGCGVHNPVYHVLAVVMVECHFRLDGGSGQCSAYLYGLHLLGLEQGVGGIALQLIVHLGERRQP